MQLPARNIKKWWLLMGAIAVGMLAPLLASCATSTQATDPALSVLQDIRPYSPLTVDQASLELHEIPHRAHPKVVVVMYHNLVYGRTGSEYNRDIYNFEHDLVFLRQRFEIIGFDDLLAIREGKRSLEHDAALITFDDGDLSMYAIAYPLLREYSIKATFFIISGSVGETGYMTWKQINEIAQYRDDSGTELFTIGSHTRTHAALGELPLQVVEKELADSKAEIEKATGRELAYLALPFGSGSGNSAIASAAKSLGYAGVRTSDSKAFDPANFDPYRIPAVLIDNSSTDKAMGKIWAYVGR